MTKKEIESVIKNLSKDFPGGSVVKNPPANAGNTWSVSDLGRSLVPQATKPVHHNYWACTLQLGSCNYWSLLTLEPVLHNKKNHCMSEVRALQLENSAHSLQIEKRPCSNGNAVQPKMNK